MLINNETYQSLLVLHFVHIFGKILVYANKKIEFNGNLIIVFRIAIMINIFIFIINFNSLNII